MTDLEVQQHFKDCLFQGIHKHIQDSIRYLYSTPRTSYLQLMVAALKIKSENEEIQDKVRARAAVTTDSGKGTTELGQKIAKLMAALTRAGQGRAATWPVPQIAQWRGHGRGWADRGTPGCPSSHNCQTSHGQTTPDHSTPTGHRTGTTISRNQGQGSQGTIARCEGTTNRRDPNALQCFKCQGRGYIAQECPTPATALNQSGGTEGMWPNPLPVTATTANSRPSAFPPPNPY